ncbi:MAG: DUF362 domain-containing protein [Gemmatimonadota bacterium]|nr:DUF362 domain-containing protein [Gemmatimonadota bacterium]
MVTLSQGLPTGYDPDEYPTIRAAVRQLCLAQGWGHEGAPLANLVNGGARVLLKPNWVLHANQGEWGLDPLISHRFLIQAVVEAALDSGAGRVVVADAPVQGCDFATLMHASGVGAWAAELQQREPRFAGVIDLRRTIRQGAGSSERTVEGVRDTAQFTLFDLGADSMLEPITTSAAAFRVTQYHPAYLARTHAPGRHQFLVSREVLEADLVINMPKLKTHKKAGITCALKNLVGINGNKEYLPHHRIGGSGSGGDCYPGSDPVKRALEGVFDRFNASRREVPRRAWRFAARVLQAIQHRRGDRIGVEGSWSGNDTVWRMCLDLNRILSFGSADGTMMDQPQRRVIHIVDAVIAGQGDGPLRPEPLPMGMILAGDSAAAVDWAGSLILGYEPDAIPIVAHAFDRFRWPITDFRAADIAVADAGTGLPLSRAELESMTPAPINHPEGWLSAVRLPA